MPPPRFTELARNPHGIQGRCVRGKQGMLQSRAEWDRAPRRSRGASGTYSRSRDGRQLATVQRERPETSLVRGLTVSLVWNDAAREFAGPNAPSPLARKRESAGGPALSRDF